MCQKLYIASNRIHSKHFAECRFSSYGLLVFQIFRAQWTFPINLPSAGPGKNTIKLEILGKSTTALKLWFIMISGHYLRYERSLIGKLIMNAPAAIFSL